MSVMVRADERTNKLSHSLGYIGTHSLLDPIRAYMTVLIGKLAAISRIPYVGPKATLVSPLPGYIKSMKFVFVSKYVL
jgi:hypothetical protein